MNIHGFFKNVCISFYVAGFELVVIFLNSFIYNLIRRMIGGFVRDSFIKDDSWIKIFLIYFV